MARVRKIPKKPKKTEKNFFVVDACFLANKYLPIGTASADEANLIRQSHKWWKEIDRQVVEERARVYIPDLCIAEAFKVLAKKYYKDNSFANYAKYKSAKDKLSNDVSLSHQRITISNQIY